MRRPLANAIALFCVLVQLGLGVSSLLGLVLCIGDDHAAIELGSDACCAGPDDALSDDCCSDIPLYAAAQQVPEAHRPTAMMSATAAAVSPSVAVVGTRAAFPAALSPAARLAIRSVVLRV